MDPAKYKEHRDLTWEELGVKIEDHIGEITLALSKNIFLTEHKLRYTVEQRKRYQLTSSIYSGAALNNSDVSLFFDSYNSFIWRSIDRSNLFRDPKIKGVKSFHEKSVDDFSAAPTGIFQLKKDIPENHNLINKLMNVLHS